MTGLASLACAAMVIHDHVIGRWMTDMLIVAIRPGLNFHVVPAVSLRVLNFGMASKARARHLNGHDISRPAAKGQQNDHESENQMAHELMILVC